MSRPLERLLAEVVEVGSTVANPKTIESFFRKLCKYRISVDIYFPASDRYFKSRVLEIKDGKILFDQLLPNSGNQLLAQGLQPALLANLDGTCICAQELPKSRVVIDPTTDEELHQIELPETLLQIQRREAFRVRIRQNEPISLELELNKHLVFGDLLDLSATGCRCSARFSDDKKPESGQHLKLRFTLPDGYTVECENIIRHCEYSKESNCYILGTQFSRLSGMHERQISLFVSRLQREERQLNNQ